MKPPAAKGSLKDSYHHLMPKIIRITKEIIMKVFHASQFIRSRVFAQCLLTLLPFAAFLILTACSSVVGAILGEREVTNLFGLNDREIIFSLPGGSGVRQGAGELSPTQTISVPVSVPFQETFNDLGDINLPLGAVPRSASEELGISPVAEVSSTSPAEAFPQQLGFSEASLELTLLDGSGSPSVSQQLPATPGQAFTFNKATCAVVEARTMCQYQATVPEIFLFTLEFEGETFDTLYNDILQSGSPTNQANGTVRLNVSTSLENFPPIPLDSTFTLVLKTRNGRIRF
jgi:hypothetical protein